MLIISNNQIRQLAIPIIKKLVLKTLSSIKNDSPEITDGKEDKEILKQLNILVEDASNLQLKQDENIIAYLILCLRHKTNFSILLQNKKIDSVIHNQGLHETEKIYLIDEMLNHEC